MALIATPRFAFAALIMGNVILALGPVLVRLSDVGPVAAGFWRLALAVPVLLLLSARELRQVRIGAKAWWLIAAAGLFFAADLASWHAGIHQTKVANSTLFGNASALLLPLWGMIVLRQKLHWMQGVALALAAAGAAVLMGGSYEASPRYFHGDMLCLLAGIFYTAYILIVQNARRDLSNFAVLAVVSITGAGPLLIAALALGEQVMPVDWTPLIILALSSQVIGQGLMVYAMAWFSPLVLGLSLLLQPAVAALLGWAMFGEGLSFGDIVGAVAIGVALVLVRLPGRA
jgi:drug/metabolite transporter (DMT)-like permease